jgi:hypothetical protein
MGSAYSQLEHWGYVGSCFLGRAVYGDIIIIIIVCPLLYNRGISIIIVIYSNISPHISNVDCLTHYSHYDGWARNYCLSNHDTR